LLTARDGRQPSGIRDLDAEGGGVSRRNVEALGGWLGLGVRRVNHNTDALAA